MIYNLKKDKNKIIEYKRRFLTTNKFIGLNKVVKCKDIRKNSILVFNHSVYIIYIRAKFLFLAITDNLSTTLTDRNEFAILALLKAYWETVSLLGCFIIKAKLLINSDEYKKLFDLSSKLSLGGKKFPSKESLLGRNIESDYFITPNVLTMMDEIDKDWTERFRKSGKLWGSGFRELYDNYIAEAGHPNHLGLELSCRWIKNKTILYPDINKSWNSEDEAMITNCLTLSTVIFFDYWDDFLLIKSSKFGGSLRML